MLATREKRFIIGFLMGFVVFGTLMNLLSGGFSKFQLMWATGMPGALKIIWDAIIAILGVGVPVAEWLPIFAIAVLQGALIGLVALLWQKKRVQNAENMRLSEVANRGEAATSNAENVQKVGIITGLIALGAGCPTCGTTLITPLLSTIFSTGSLAMAGIVSNVVTVAAVVVALLSLKRLGLETYVIIVNEKYLRKRKSGVKDGEEIKSK